MRKTFKIFAIGLAVLLLIAGGVAGWLYYASQQTPDFYREALAMDEASAREASREMLARASELRNRARKEGAWQVVFTAQQINGWLAVDRVKNHPNLLPTEFQDPRVAIAPRSANIGCQYNGDEISTVLSLEVDAYVSQPNVLAVRLRKAWAGSAPLPLGKVLDAVKKAAAQTGLSLEWRQIDGDPVALITLPPPRDSREPILRLETLELREGAVFLAGRTEKPGESYKQASRPPLTAERSAADHATVQR